MSFPKSYLAFLKIMYGLPSSGVTNSQTFSKSNLTLVLKKFSDLIKSLNSTPATSVREFNLATLYSSYGPKLLVVYKSVKSSDNSY
jgi:hypothetical protein